MTSLGTDGAPAELVSSTQLSLLEEPSDEELSFSENPVTIVAPDGLGAMGEVASARGYLWVPLAQPGPAYRGRLGLFIEESIERELEERGALAPGIQSSTGLDASLSDQLYRARLLEMRGLALGVPDLTGISNLARVMDAEDSAVLRWWIAATSDRPVRLVLSQDNIKLRVFPSPIPFHSLFDVAPLGATPRPPHEGMAQSAETMALSDLPPEVRVEEETSLLGTEVNSCEAQWGGDVELPDLDAALGLNTPVPIAPTEQLALAYDSRDGTPSPADLEESSPQAPVVSEVFASPGEEVPLEGLDLSPRVAPSVERALPEPHDCVSQPVSQPGEDCLSSGVLAQQQEAEPLAVERPAPEEIQRVDEGRREGLDDDLGDLDADDFLRTLAEDSERAPVVHELRDGDASQRMQTSSEPEPPCASPRDAVAEIVELGELGKAPATEETTEALAASGQAVPQGMTPLPTKKIIRKPFIRLADERDTAVGDSGEGQAIQPATSNHAGVGGAERRLTHQEPVVSAAAPAESVQEAHDPSDPSDPFNQLAARQWRAWVKNLEAARGPKPLSVIERMFVTDYTRLKEAVRRGVADPEAEETLIEWRQSFSNSYSEAFDALRVRGKRPTMVLDLPELAARLGRLQGATRVQLLLVDGMRFDLGLMIQDKMRNRAGAALTERLLLWSALPSVTSYQLELLGKGPDGLKEAPSMDAVDTLVARGKAACTPRRMRTGALELLKLDIVEDALRHPGVPVIERMDRIATDTAAAITDYLAKLPPRSMVVVFGDHGFDLDPKAAGTTEEVIQGGATPEEVLVPAFAWLTGAMH